MDEPDQGEKGRGGRYLTPSVGFITRDCNQHAQHQFPTRRPIYTVSLIDVMAAKINEPERRVVSRENAMGNK